MILAIMLTLGMLFNINNPYPVAPAVPAPFSVSAGPGTQIWYMVGNELWAMNSDGGNQIRVASDLRLDPSGCIPYYVSPSGRHIAYQLNDGQLQIANSDGTNAQTVATGRVGSVSWATDNSNIIYALNDDIYLYRLEGGASEPVATGGGRFFFPTYAPDGRNIAFLEAPGGNVFNVMVIRTKDQDWRSLGTTAHSPHGPDNACPDIVRWSPDGTKVLVDYGQPVFIFYLAGGTPTQVGGQGNSASHFWSPSGNMVAYKETDGSLWLMNPDGSGQRPLVAEPVGGIAWNPANQPLLAYTTVQPGGIGDLWIINTDNGQKQQLTGGDTSLELNPVWAGGGSTVLFERRGLQGEEQGIWRVAPDGSGLVQLSPVGTAMQLR